MMDINVKILKGIKQTEPSTTSGKKEDYDQMKFNPKMNKKSSTLTNQ